MRRPLSATLASIAIAMSAAAHTFAAPDSVPSVPPRLTEAEYIALIGGYEALQSSLLAVLQGLQTAKDMRSDVAMVIIGTPRQTPRGPCGIALSRYRRLLIAYARAIGKGALYGPPTDLTLSRFEKQASVVCRPRR